MSPQSVAIVIVTFGHEAVLPATLRSVLAQAYPATALETIVVENGDGACAAVARRIMPHATVVEPGRNLGFAGGSNLGVARSTADVVLLVNPDVELDPAFVGAMVEALDDPTVGVAGARLLNPDRATLQHAGGELVLPLGLSRHRGYGQPDAAPYDAPVDVDYVTGAALGMRRTVWDVVGGLDEAFNPAYYEEVDLCWRVRKAGLRVRYAPAAHAIHQESSGLGKGSVPFYRLYHLNRLRLLFKYYDDQWLASAWLLAELEHLRTTADDNEIAGLCWAYTRWQSALIAATTPRAEGWRDEPMPSRAIVGSELAWTLDQARQKRALAPQPFQSRIPLLARLRTWWNAVATTEYVRPLVQQQNDFNATLVELGAALERQRRTTDGAVLCQGMLLAKVLRQKRADDE